MQVASCIKQAMKGCSQSTFLLEDDTTLPFAASDIAAKIGDKVLVLLGSSADGSPDHCSLTALYADEDYTLSL